MTDPREQYRRAWQTLLDVAEQVPPERWDAPSPCAGWTARQLAGHVIDGARQVHVMFTGEPPLVPTTAPTRTPISQVRTRPAPCARTSRGSGRPWTAWPWTRPPRPHEARCRSRSS